MKYIASILLLITMLALIALAIVYISNRFALFFPAITKKVWLCGFGGMLAVALAGVMPFSITDNPVGKFVAILSGIVGGIRCNCKWQLRVFLSSHHNRKHRYLHHVPKQIRIGRLPSMLHRKVYQVWHSRHDRLALLCASDKLSTLRLQYFPRVE